MPGTAVTLAANITKTNLRVVLKHFERAGRLSPAEWPLALESFHRLGAATLRMGGRPVSFRTIYERYVDRPLGDKYIRQLVELTDLDRGAQQLQRQAAQRLLTELEESGLYHENIKGSEYLAAYCFYWWTAFMRGYQFELTVFRDLAASGVAFLAHDITKRRERRSPQDLVVLGQLGDIKTTTYFLSTAATEPLKSDFYITRLYDAMRRRYIWIALLTRAAWDALDGGVRQADLQEAADLFPQPVQITIQGNTFVVVPYETWKDKVKARQATKG